MISEKVFKLKKNGEAYSTCLCRHPELIENYDKAIADTTQVWECHHRFELQCPIYKPSYRDLMAWSLYYDRPANELIFLSPDEHRRLHFKGKPRSEEWSKKISEAKKGKPRSEETKRRMSEGRKITMKVIRTAYQEYKANGDELSWNSFQKFYAKKAI